MLIDGSVSFTGMFERDTNIAESGVLLLLPGGVHFLSLILDHSSSY